MSRKGPEIGLGMLDFEEDCRIGVKSHQISVMTKVNINTSISYPFYNITPVKGGAQKYHKQLLLYLYVIKRI